MERCKAGLMEAKRQLQTKTKVTLNLVWSGLLNGSEVVSVDAADNASLYDRAGNALMTGSAKSDSPTVPVAISDNPDNTSTCESGTATFTAIGIGCGNNAMAGFDR